MESKNFIDFILDSQESEELTNDFLNSKSEGDLTDFFHKNGYAMEPDDIAKIWEIKTKLPEVPPWGRKPSVRY